MDLALNDERQQYSNLDEASALARVPEDALLSGVATTSKLLEVYARRRKLRPSEGNF